MIPKKVIVYTGFGVLILGSILAALIIPARLSIIKNAQVAKAKADLAKLSDAIGSFEKSHHRLPTEKEGFSVVSGPGKDASDLHSVLNESVSIDPWNHSYVFKQVDSHGERGFQVRSYGTGTKPGEDPDSSIMVDGDFWWE